MGPLKFLFGTRMGKPLQPNEVSYERLQELSFQEVLACANLFKSLRMPAEPAMAIMRKFYDIALYDNHIPEKERDIALRLADALASDLETTFTADPEKYAALQKAIKWTKDNASRSGRG